jgi:hypothetical protein
VKRLGIGSAVIWLIVSVAPYSFVGEYWGLTWMSLNYPLSVAFSEIGAFHIGYPYVYTAVVTITNAIIYGYVVACVARVIHVIRDRSK